MDTDLDTNFASNSKKLAERLKELKIGEQISYKELSDIIGMSVQASRGRGQMDQAHNKLLRGDRLVFDVIRGKGLQRLDDIQIVQTAPKAQEKIRRGAKRAITKVVCANYSTLTREKQIEHNTYIAMFGVVAAVSTEKGYIGIRSKVEEAGSNLSNAVAAMAALSNIS